jgi:thymidylate synthase (FAD)
MKPEIKLMWKTPDPEFQIIRAARICYNSEDKIDSRWEPTEQAQNVMMGGGMQLDIPMVRVKIGPKDESLLRKLMSNQHNTCLRFASAAFQIQNVSRVCTHQLVRIAHFGILQRSQRYCNEGETDFYIPEKLSDGEYEEFFSRGRKLYDQAIKDGVSEEMARYLLPNGALSQINLVSNFQGWKHLLKIRLSKKVQYETRVVAAELCKQLYEMAPIVFEANYKKLERIGL